MNFIAPIHVVVALLSLVTMGMSSVSFADTADLDARLKQAVSTHPRLFFTDAEKPALKAKLDADPAMKAAYGRLLADAEALKKCEPVQREKVGKRLLGVSRACLQRVSYLAFAYRMTGDETLLRRAEQEMLAAAAFEDWNPSHFLDVAEMTAALAIGYDWLYNDLDPDARNTIREAIVIKGLDTSLKGGGWVATTNNWNQVCHGGLVLGALAVLEDKPDLAHQIVERAIANVPRAMHEYEPDGVYPEGPGYWEYGTTYNVLMIAALESVLGADFGLAASPGFMETPRFYIEATGPTGLFFNFSDCGARGGIAPAMHWFAGRLNDPNLLWNEKRALDVFVTESPKADGSGDRMLAFLLIWGQPTDRVTPPPISHWKGDGRTPIAVLRSGWTETVSYLAIKGGSPRTNHAHMDIGSFVLDMDGVRWAIDLGSQGYHGLESQGVDLWNMRQESQRWTVFRLNNRSHNTLVVDDKLQQVKGHAPIIAFSREPANPHAVVDMSPVYEGQLADAKRGARLLGDAALIQDELTTLDNPASVRWGMVTNAQVEISEEDASTAILRKDGKTLSLKVLSPEHATLAIYDTENPPQEYDGKNPNTRMIGFEAAIAPATMQTLTVLLASGTTPQEAPAPKALKDW